VPGSDIDVPRKAAPACTILVVEDDVRVRRLAIARLEEVGYRVLEAGNGRDALDILERVDVDVLFADMMLPGSLSGREVAKRARDLKPGIRVLLTSGGLIGDERELGHEQFLLLRKPYGQAELVEALRKVVAAPGR
jgi:CheY-like chemotaxis protein